MSIGRVCKYEAYDVRPAVSFSPQRPRSFFSVHENWGKRDQGDVWNMISPEVKILMYRTRMGIRESQQKHQTTRKENGQR